MISLFRVILIYLYIHSTDNSTSYHKHRVWISQKYIFSCAHTRKHTHIHTDICTSPLSLCINWMVFIVKQIETNDLIHFGQLKQSERKKNSINKRRVRLRRKKMTKTENKSIKLNWKTERGMWKMERREEWKEQNEMDDKHKQIGF